MASSFTAASLQGDRAFVVPYLFLYEMSVEVYRNR